MHKCRYRIERADQSDRVIAPRLRSVYLCFFLCNRIQALVNVKLVPLLDLFRLTRLVVLQLRELASSSNGKTRIITLCKREHDRSLSLLTVDVNLFPVGDFPTERKRWLRHSGARLSHRYVVELLSRDVSTAIEAVKPWR